MRLPVLLLALLCATLPGRAATTSGEPPPFPTGILVEGVAALADGEMTYSLYLPPGYTAERRWPVLLVFDPRGRSVLAAERFLAGAERFGWIVVSSDDTRSDGPWEPNLRAVNALLPELDRRFAVDARRVYAAGFSGGAHLAWLLGVQALGQQGAGLAGVVAAGGRDAAAWMVDDVPFASFATVGDVDFNYAGTMRVDDHFAARGARHRVQVFHGPHAWMPPEMAFDAMAWLEVVAMVEGRRPVDGALALDRLRAELDDARELAAAGAGEDLRRAARRYDALLRTHGELVQGIADTKAAGADLTGDLVSTLDTARREVAALRRRPAFRAAVQEARRWDGYERTVHRRLGAVLARLGDVERPVSAGRIAKELDIERLRRRAAGSGYGATTTERLLHLIHTQTGFYLTRGFFAAGRYRSAAVVLEVATRARPERPGPWYHLACARARLGRTGDALEALERALDAGYADLPHLRADPDLESLRGEERFQALLRRLEEASP